MKNPDKEETDEEAQKELKENSGSSAYVAKEPEKDTQLQYALSFLRGTAKDAKTAGASVETTQPPGTDTKEKAKN